MGGPKHSADKDVGLRALWHLHWPRSTFHAGANAYQTCRCGARRTRRGLRGLSPIKPGWPKPSDGWSPAAREDGALRGCEARLPSVVRTCGCGPDDPPCQAVPAGGKGGHLYGDGIARARVLPPARCACGTDATSLTPGEVVVHRYDGQPCYIAAAVTS